ncbi:FAD-dependent monooxygenase [Allokutzneria oryzae]|uniref:FAD-dependent monooxygenase n=1 Tax=Allokutzneria oryzae TaxID=1378989 RepID=A0ABV6A228_9PSEU
MTDVVIVGAGPVGLWLASELHRSGVEVTVLERLAEPVPAAKALTLHPRSLELLAMRGLAQRWLDAGKALPSSHFALLDNRLSYAGLDTRFPFVLFIPQPRTEAMLAEHASALGVEVLRDHTVTGVRDEGESVVVDAESVTGPRSFRARWVVGCDGPSSTVRKAAGIEFVGTPSTMSVAMGDVRLTDPPEAVSWTVNCDRGALFLTALGDGRYRVSPIDHATLHTAKDAPLTLEELRESTRRVVGTDFGMYEPTYLARFGNATLQASRYRSGRILLAGDAAHIHMPLGGQGLNLGMQDASNLAWKLTAVVNGWAPDTLLDSYEAERYPVGQRVLEDTRAQTALVIATTPESKALRTRFNEMLARHPSLNHELATQLSGLGVTYPVAGADVLVGQRMPDLDLGQETTVFGLLRTGRFVLLDLTGDTYADLGPMVDVVHASTMDTSRHPEWEDVRSVLLRPDGHVAWVTRIPAPSAHPHAALLHALT